MEQQITTLISSIMWLYKFSRIDARMVVEDTLQYNQNWDTFDEMKRECFMYAQRLVNSKLNEIKV